MKDDRSKWTGNYEDAAAIDSSHNLILFNQHFHIFLRALSLHN